MLFLLKATAEADDSENEYVLEFTQRRSPLGK
jgi:hypothetical protein